MSRVQLTVRLDHADYLKLTRIAHDARLSHNQVAAALLHRALEAGWTVKAGSQPVAEEPQT
jgi:hypothetical protein